MAALHAVGRLQVGERFTHEGILDTVMIGAVTGATRVGGFAAIECTVSGRAYITGSFNFYLDPEDPFPAGFRLTGV